MAPRPRPAAIDILDQMATDFIRRDVAQHAADPVPTDGRHVSVGGRAMLNFGSCSYLGLETHPALKAGVEDAVRRFGTQFSSSRAYISHGLYGPLEALLAQIFERPVVVASSTTLGHIAALPVLVGDDDAVILDHQVHHSVQSAAQLLKARGVPLHVIRHNDMAQLERKIADLQGRHRHIWYFADGVYSMFGDFAPVQTLHDLMDRYPSFHTYVDDAHGMSWSGPNGRGVVRAELPHHPKMVLAVSLNKAFACAGGALVFPDERMATLVRNTGGTLIFSGPIQPPMLGAALAAARLHLSDELAERQRALFDLIDHTNARLDALGLPQYRVTRSPLYFIPVGLPRVVANLARRLLAEGFYVNMATFPATPMRQGGLRFMLNHHLTRADVDALLDRVRHHYPLALAEEGTSPAEVARIFRIPAFECPPLADGTDATADGIADGLQIERARTIRDLDGDAWDARFAGRGNFDAAGLALLEDCFTRPDAPENVWDFHYLTVRDPAGRVVLSTFFTVALVKDDMKADARVSAQIEAQRAHDPYWLTSRAVMLGCLISKGAHLWLDREHPRWPDAVRALVAEMQRVREAGGANQIMLREFFTDADPALRQLMLDEGFVEIPLGDTLQVRDLGWTDHDDWLARLGGRYRHDVRKEILRHADAFEATFEPPTTDAEIDACYALYRAVHARSFELNVHPLPRRFFAAMCHHPDYDIIRLHRRGDAERQTLAVMFSHRRRGTYSALIVGLDERARREGIYKQILHRTVHRAWQLGSHLLDLAYTADLAKKKLGARPYAACAYVQTESLYNHAIIDAMSPR